MSQGDRGRFELVIAGQEDVLLRNEGGGFRSVNREAGITGHGIGLAATWWDYNGDHRPDLYVSNGRVTENNISQAGGRKKEKQHKMDVGLCVSPPSQHASVQRSYCNSQSRYASGSFSDSRRGWWTKLNFGYAWGCAFSLTSAIKKIPSY